MCRSRGTPGPGGPEPGRPTTGRASIHTVSTYLGNFGGLNLRWIEHRLVYLVSARQGGRGGGTDGSEADLGHYGGAAQGSHSGQH